MNEVFQALSDPTRREILRLLRKRDMTAGELAEQFPLARSTLSGHFSALKHAGLDCVAHLEEVFGGHDLVAAVQVDDSHPRLVWPSHDDRTIEIATEGRRVRAVEEEVAQNVFVHLLSSG